MERTKLILDMDSDTDGLLALAYALASPELEVLGVVTGHGFYQPETAAAGIRALLTALGRELPVIPGAQRPLMRANLEQVLQRPAPGTVMSTAAWDWMYRALTDSPDPVTVCLLGPATNLMHLLHKYPDCAAKIDRILFAGGAFSFGTVTASACHRVYFDAEAMQLLLHSGIPFEMASVDVTSGYEACTETLPLMERWGGLWAALAGQAPAPVPASRALRSPLAMVSLTHPALFRYTDCKCEVDLHGSHTYGMTVVYLNHYAGMEELPDGTKVRRTVADADKNIRYMERFDRELALSIVAERIGTLCGKGGAV